MKKITLLISAFALVTTAAFAQSKSGKTITPPTRNCGTMDGVSQEDLQSFEEFLAPKVAAYLQAQENGGTPEAVYTIPTIVHIIHNSNEGVGSGRNIPYTRVTEQMTVLNDDFRRTNADASNTPASFAGVAADTEINFCLITTYPSGHPQAGNPLPEVGVDRVDATTIGVGNTTSGYPTATIDGTIKPATSWNPNEVMNIWVMQLQGGLLGYAQFPNSGAANTDGTVMQYTTFGLTGGVFGLGRTTTHEVGHWLGCFHIWGDDGGACTGSDQVADTPNQANSTNSCPSGVQTDACATSSPGYQYQNYMDYTFDACMNMFTLGQKARMQSTMASAPRRATLNGFSATLCAPISTASDDAGIVGIITPVGNYCSGNIAPVVNLRNFGSNTLTAVTINYLVDGAAQTPFAWTGSLAQNTSLQVVLPTITAGLGAHTFDANTTMPNGTTDGTPGNDAATQSSFNVQSATGASMPFFEGFEGTYLPTGWSANNDDGATTWAQTSVAAKTGNNSAFMDYYNYSGSKGLYDDIITPAIDLTGSATPQVTFELAYQLYTNPNDPTPFSDTLEVLISVDCGVNWTSLYRKESLTLVTASPTFSTASFVPAPADWRMETISLNAYSGAANAMIMFRGIGDYENQMYIDDININAAFPVGISEVSSYDVSIYPNPATNVINVVLPSVENTEVAIFNMVGEVIYQNNKLTKTNFTVDMSNHSNGIYFVKVKSNNNVITKKVTIAK